MAGTGLDSSFTTIGIHKVAGGAENLTQCQNIGNAFAIQGEPVVINGPGTAQHVFARNGAGHLLHYYWGLNDGWKAENLIQYPNTQIALASALLARPILVSLPY